MAVPMKLAKATLPIDVASRPTSSPATLFIKPPASRAASRLPCPPFVLHFPRVLAEGRRGAPDRRPFPVHEHGRGEHPEHVGRGMLDLLQHVRAREVLVCERLGERVDRPARHVGGPDSLDPLVRRPLGELFLKELHELLPLRHPVGVSGVALVVGQVLAADGLAQLPELGVVADGDGYLLVRGVEGLVGDYRRVAVPHAPLVLAGDEVLLAAIGEPTECALEERYLDARALSRGVASAQGGEDGGHGVEAADDVRDRDADLRGLAARFGEAGYPHDASASLDQEVVPGTFLVLPRPEAGNGTVHEAGVCLPERLVAEAEPLEGASLHVLDQHVRMSRELPDLLQPLRVLEVHAHRALVAVDGEEVSRLAAGFASREGRAPLAGVVAALWVLDLHHVSPEVREHHRRVWPGQHPGEVEDLNAFEGQVHARLPGWSSMRKSRVEPRARLRPRCAPLPRVAGGSRNASPSEARRGSRPSSNSYSISPSTT